MIHPFLRLIREMLLILLYVALLCCGASVLRATTIHCKAYDYPRIVCECSATRHQPVWNVIFHDKVTDWEKGNVVFLTVSDEYSTVVVSHGDIQLGSFKVRWNGKRIEFMN